MCTYIERLGDRCNYDCFRHRDISDNSTIFLGFLFCYRDLFLDGYDFREQGRGEVGRGNIENIEGRNDEP